MGQHAQRRKGHPVFALNPGALVGAHVNCNTGVSPIAQCHLAGGAQINFLSYPHSTRPVTAQAACVVNSQPKQISTLFGLFIYMFSVDTYSVIREVLTGSRETHTNNMRKSSETMGMHVGSIGKHQIARYRLIQDVVESHCVIIFKHAIFAMHT